MTLHRGLYDAAISDSLARALDADPADERQEDAPTNDQAADRLADALRDQLARILDDRAQNGVAPSDEQLALVNDLLRSVRSSRPKDQELIDLLHAPARVLRSIHPRGAAPFQSPETGLAAPWLFTAGRGSPSLIAELRREAAACDSIDILVSFITVSGVRKLIDVLKSATAADASGRGRTKIRVLTTTYMGATEVLALDELARLNGCEVRVSLDGRRTRLHAKAWIFQRATGFGSAYVGSANLSGAALMGGLEWTVKFTERGEQGLFTRAKAHFDTLWLDGEFTTYVPDDEINRNAVIEALRREGGAAGHGPLTYFDIQPKLVPAGHARPARARTRTRPQPQSRRRSHRHRQDRPRRTRLPRHRHGSVTVHACSTSHTATRS